ncbi:MAG: DUF2203 domain-containing protein [Candidatus Latescibacteria bacterium]|nr:DUF2203 domain-containing protein [Candidatus Latescibacterota bacterium]
MATTYFTVEEANALLPQITPLLKMLSEVYHAITVKAGEIEPYVAQKAAGNGGHPEGGAFILQLEQLSQGINRVQSFGCLIKDIGSGLIDFPSLKDGREVYLCFRLGEEKIEFWHDIDTGFAGRQPL